MDLSNYKKEIKQIDYYANKLYSGLSSFSKVHVDRDDLIQAGYIGLMDAVNKSNLKRTPLLITYAQIRIRGQMIDCIRSFCPLSKHVVTNPQKYPTIFVDADDCYYDEHLVQKPIDTDIMDLETLLGTSLPGTDESRRRYERVLDNYLLGISHTDIAIMEGVSESRISQLMKEIIYFARLEYEG